MSKVTPIAPTVTLSPASTSVTTAQSLQVTIAVSGTRGTPTGSVTVSSGSSYTSASATLSSGSANITIPAGSLSSGSPTLTATYTPDTASAALYSMTSSTAVVVTVSKTTPTVTWATPAAITYGTALSAMQLNATANVAGSFVYIPAAGDILGVGTSTLQVTFTPTDATNYSGVTQTVSLTVNQATPTITWAAPSAITYGTEMGSTQLNATANEDGRFV